MAKRVAVVDDEQDLLTLMQMILTEQGYEVGLCAEGSAAFEFIKRWQPDVVFLDIRMTGESGWQILRRLKADPSTRDIKVVMTSAATDEISAAEADLRAQGSDILVKPFDIDEVLKKAGPPTSRNKPGDG